MKDRSFQASFNHVVSGGGPALSQKQGQRLPTPQQVADRLTQTRVGISFPLGKLRLERSRQGDGTDTDNTELNSLGEKVPAAVFEVSNTLGAGFLEKVYQRADG
jgi:hypothetical protein